MTTKIIVEAHCGKNKVVEILINEGNGLYLGKRIQDGESWTGCIFDDKSVKITEENNVVSK